MFIISNYTAAIPHVHNDMLWLKMMCLKIWRYKIVEFIKKCFFTELAFLWTLTSVNSLGCISMNNQECKVRRQIVSVNSEESICFPFSIKTNKCSGSCSNINNP